MECRRPPLTPPPRQQPFQREEGDPAAEALSSPPYVLLPPSCPASPVTCPLRLMGRKRRDWLRMVLKLDERQNHIKTHLLPHLPASDVTRSGVGPENPLSNKFQGDGGGAAGPRTMLRTASWEAYVSSGGTEVSSEVLRNLTHSPLCSPSPTTTRLSSQGVRMWRKESESRAFTTPSDHWPVKPWFTSTKTHSTCCALALMTGIWEKLCSNVIVLWWAGKEMHYRRQSSWKQKQTGQTWDLQRKERVPAEECPWRFSIHKRLPQSPSPSSSLQILSQPQTDSSPPLLETLLQATWTHL